MTGRGTGKPRIAREIPDPHIRDAADQYYEASVLLHRHCVPGSGILHPTINTSAVAIELYLKALSSETKYTPEGGGWIVNSRADGGHKLFKIADNIPADVRAELDAAFGASALTAYGSLEEILVRLANTFMESRYPFESGDNVRRYDIGLMEAFPRFLAEFVRDCRVRFYLYADES